MFTEFTVGYCGFELQPKTDQTWNFWPAFKKTAVFPPGNGTGQTEALGPCGAHHVAGHAGRSSAVEHHSRKATDEVGCLVRSGAGKRFFFPFLSFLLSFSFLGFLFL